MARTPEGPAAKKPLTGITGQSNIEPYSIPLEEYDAIDKRKGFYRWLLARRYQSHKLVADEGMWGAEGRPDYDPRIDPITGRKFNDT